MEILYLKSVDSTHRYLQEYIKNNGYISPLAIFTSNQTNGIGSRDNLWHGEEGNFYLSFVISKDKMPQDIQIQSLSIYFSFILKDLLKSLNSNVWLKWPNDFYLEDKKIGGTITTISKDFIYCGIGINFKNLSNEFKSLDINISNIELLDLYIIELEKYPSWKQIFSKYSIEFHYSKKFYATVDNEKVSLKNSILNDDGSIQVDNKKVFSLR
ncbi:MAG TPA: biotin--[acetyl-CoA-carboxylase] ligase [Arcobacter sp.]|nr:biotin--[acetyl-CoA-carboxylase] ligase [Arcobacter sp.]HIP56340.1 biotin--[acetyl-CoA-carboxylase] ligase [Arcobacter sp.]